MSTDRLGREVVLEEGVRVVMPEYSDRVLGALERGFQLAHDLDIWQVHDVVDECDFARVGCPRIRTLHPVIRHVNGQLAPLRFIRCASVYQYTVSLLLVILLLGCLVWRSHRGHGLGQLALLQVNYGSWAVEDADRVRVSTLVDAHDSILEVIAHDSLAVRLVVHRDVHPAVNHLCRPKIVHHEERVMQMVTPGHFDLRLQALQPVLEALLGRLEDLFDLERLEQANLDDPLAESQQRLLAFHVAHADEECCPSLAVKLNVLVRQTA